MAAQAAVGFIKSGCEMLHQGRMELENAKGLVEGVIGDVKAIKGIWDWFIGLFASKPAANEPAAKSLAKKKTAKQQQTYEELELKLINDVGAQLGNFFDIQQQLKTYYDSLETESKEHYDPNQNTSKKAIERALVELQMENLDAQIREQMTIYAPAELKAIYTRFLKMYAKIQQEQEWARSEMIRKARFDRWKQEQEDIQFIEITSGVIAVMFVSLIFGWLMWQLRVLSGGF
jgi:hypothetical protein